MFGFVCLNLISFWPVLSKLSTFISLYFYRTLHKQTNARAKLLPHLNDNSLVWAWLEDCGGRVLQEGSRPQVKLGSGWLGFHLIHFYFYGNHQWCWDGERVWNRDGEQEASLRPSQEVVGRVRVEESGSTLQPKIGDWQI